MKPACAGFVPVFQPRRQWCHSTGSWITLGNDGKFAWVLRIRKTNAGGRVMSHTWRSPPGRSARGAGWPENPSPTLLPPVLVIFNTTNPACFTYRPEGSYCAVQLLDGACRLRPAVLQILIDDPLDDAAVVVHITDNVIESRDATRFACLFHLAKLPVVELG